MIDQSSRLLKVFLCHASDDKPIVQNLYSRLVKDGVDAWLDKEKLIPGQNWKIEIPKAVKSSDIVIVCVSTKSVNKEGFFQKEIAVALDIADEKPEGTIYIIPARLENCNVPERISQFHWVDLFESNGYEWLIKALEIRAKTLGVNREIKNTSSQTVASGIISGVFYRQNGKGEYSILQFYNDGLVIGQSMGNINDLHNDWSYISRWFHRDYESKGSYHLIGNDITFNITSPEGTIEYSGKYLDGKFILSIYSLINGRQTKNQVYTRLKS